MTDFQYFDLTLLQSIYNLCHNSIFDKIMPVISSAGNLGAIWILFSVFLIISKKYRRTGIICLTALIITSIAGEGIIKNLVQRPRPFNELQTVHILISRPVSFSFPSGHTASSFAAAYIISRDIKKLTVPVFCLAVLIAFSRMYLLVHYPSDIAGGIILGLLCAYAVRKLYIKFESKKVQP